MTKYTKGNWRQAYNNETVIIADIGDKKLTVCAVQETSHIDIKEALSNAKLIAAAPNLLEALERFVKFTDGVKAAQDEKQGYVTKFESSMILEAKAAIKKATEGT